MKREIYDEWLKRLESGKIPQTGSRLRDGDKRCCLGVLCDVLDAPVELVVRQGEGYRINGTLVVGMLPEAVKRELGLDHEVFDVEFPERPGDDYAQWLAHMNDEGKSFKHIAAWIRENVPVED